MAPSLSEFIGDGQELIGAYLQEQQNLTAVERFSNLHDARHASGAPSLVLEGSSWARARALGVTEVKVALTHERRMAAAFCIAVRD